MNPEKQNVCASNNGGRFKVRRYSKRVLEQTPETPPASEHHVAVTSDPPLHLSLQATDTTLSLGSNPRSSNPRGKRAADVPRGNPKQPSALSPHANASKDLEHFSEDTPHESWGGSDHFGRRLGEGVAWPKTRF